MNDNRRNGGKEQPRRPERRPERRADRFADARGVSVACAEKDALTVSENSFFQKLKKGSSMNGGRADPSENIHV